MNQPVALHRHLNTLGLLGITGVLCSGFVLQLALDELPCPLCLLQRVAFVLVMYGFLMNVLRGPSARHYGIVILSALFGASVALRQVALHVVPGTGAYGSPVFGLHFYTWSFLIFAATLLAAGLILATTSARAMALPHTPSPLERGVCWAAVGVVLLNALATFVECGPWVCADNPTDYWLLS